MRDNHSGNPGREYPETKFPLARYGTPHGICIPLGSVLSFGTCSCFLLANGWS